MKKDMPECEFFGADPIEDPNREMFDKIGQFYNIAVSGKNGTVNATVLEQGTICLIDQLMIDIEWAEYEMLPYFLRSGDLESSDIAICQSQNATDINRCVVARGSNTMFRLYLLNHEHHECRRRYVMREQRTSLSSPM
ncbi:unnamed protein product [Angiostrongylus costaricensis]|uniref:Methyltransf_21 domain-containing protein n=1 Tax=Angiostrongylus costaricensis TaxID=334426 RepID=A0A0R3Q0N8_ANGCS|nr:unnamed protein product [Angiostrongylus costaricensis]